MLTDREVVITHLDDLRLFADVTVYPVVSPDNWDVYSSLCDYIDQIKTDVEILLKEQEPKKIIRKQMSYEDPDGTITFYAEWHCPHCNKVVQKGFGSPWLKYCFNCGKPILWD